MPVLEPEKRVTVGNPYYTVKEPPIKKTLVFPVLVLVPFFILSGLFAQESVSLVNDSDHTLSLGASLGMLAGQGAEIVYWNNVSNRKVSELLWNFTLPYVGVEAHYAWRRPAYKLGFFADASFKAGLGHGFEDDVMEDRDWVSTDPDWLTHYSVHDNKTENALLFDLTAGLSVRIFDKFLLKPSLSYQFMYFSWTASNGSGLYPSDEFSPDIYPGHGYFQGDMGTYKQIWHIISAGVSFYGEFNDYFDIDLSLKLGIPVWIVAEDQHLARSLVIIDELKGGFFIEPAMVFSYKPNSRFTLSLSSTIRFIALARGDAVYSFTAYNPTDPAWPGRTYTNISGAEFFSLDFGLMVKYKLF